MPSWPTSLLPQHFTPPPITIAHVWKTPVAMAMAEPPARGGGEMLSEVGAVGRGLAEGGFETGVQYLVYDKLYDQRLPVSTSVV
jgi:hypothetical protein